MFFYNNTNKNIIHEIYVTIEQEVEFMEKLVYSIQEVAELLGLSRSYTYQLVRNGTIPFIQLGNKRIIPKEKFNNWLNEKCE